MLRQSESGQAHLHSLYKQCSEGNCDLSGKREEADPKEVDDADQAAVLVGDPRVGPLAVLVAHQRDQAGHVGVAGHAPEGGALGGDPPVLVVGVVDLDDAVGVGDPGQ